MQRGRAAHAAAQMLSFQGLQLTEVVVRRKTTLVDLAWPFASSALGESDPGGLGSESPLAGEMEAWFGGSGWVGT